MTGHGGWPLTAFLDPDGVPFYGGTYFPPEPRQGMPSFRMVMEAVVESWTTQRERIRASADAFASSSAPSGGIEPSDDELEPRDPGRRDPEAAHAGRHAPRRLRRRRRSSRPPPPSSCCSPAGVTDVVEMTLDAMAYGGIYDQIGGGFARYSVDDAWLVPHFEKMLYDNALLARAYLHALAGAGPRALPPGLRGDARLGAARDARPRGRLLLRARRRLRGRGGPLLRLDAGRDPRGARRGRPRGLADEVIALLRGHRGGQLRGSQHPPPPRRAGGRAARAGSTRRAAPLYEHRSERVWPGLDDKRLRSWNALMIAALAEAGARDLGREDYLDAARGVRRVRLARTCATSDGRLLRTYKDGRGAARRLPRGLRVPGRGAADAVRGDLRRALVRRRARDRRPDDRAASPTPSAAASSPPPTTTRS